jgi:hypothetical protein
LLTSVLRLAAGLRLWRRRSMASSWHNFLYASFDPAGFVSDDKPPLALWIYAGLLAGLFLALTPVSVGKRTICSPPRAQRSQHRSSSRRAARCGRFHGLDSILTSEKLARMVEAGEVRFVSGKPVCPRLLPYATATRG